MKLITTTQEYKALFISLLKTYEHYYFATAWASMPKEVIPLLEKHKLRIKQMVVGIHFYQTHPDFFDLFVGVKGVRQILQPQGTFHPKIFLFKNSNSDWELLVGSANFTHSAFTANLEASIHISSNSGNSSILTDTLDFVNKLWDGADIISEDSNKRYRERWNIFKTSRKKLSTEFGYVVDKQNINKDIMLLSWDEYVAQYQKKKKLERRYYLLDYTRSLLKDHESFSDISDKNRALIAGISNHVIPKYPDIFKDFGTNTYGKFRTLITNNNHHISGALSAIPSDGAVSESDYNAFLELFLQAPNSQITWVASATRLLIMKRPDIFFSITGGNEYNFCKAFNITPSHVNLKTYWELVIERIHSCTWYQNAQPKNNIELSLKNSRAAMLDMLYY